MRFTLIAATLLLLLCACAAKSTPPRQQFCPGGCTPGTLFMAVAEPSGIALYPSPFNGSATEFIPAPGVQSFAWTLTVDTPRSLWVGEKPNTIAAYSYPYAQADGSMTTGINDPADITFAPFPTAPGGGTSIELYVANRGANNVTVIAWSPNATPTVLATFTGFSAPNCLGFDWQGNLWVCEANDVAEVAGPISARSTITNRLSSGLSHPTGIYIAPTNRDMYVADSGKNAIEVFHLGGTAPAFAITSGISAPQKPYVESNTLLVPNAGNTTVAAFAIPLVPGETPAWINSNVAAAPSAVTTLTRP